MRNELLHLTKEEETVMPNKIYSNTICMVVYVSIGTFVCLKHYNLGAIVRTGTFLLGGGEQQRKEREEEERRDTGSL